MGRKNRNKNNDIEKDISDESDVEEVIDEEEKHELDMDRFEKILNLRNQMIDYAKSNGIPLCEYLSRDIMFDFVEWSLL